MRTSLLRPALALGLLTLCLPAASMSQETPLFALRLVEEVQGPTTLTTFTVGHGELRGIALFSEPSHTLVALISDSAAAGLREADWFKAEVEPYLEGISAMRIPLQPGAAARVQTPARPAADRRIVAWVDVKGEAAPQKVELQVGPGFDVTVEVKATTYKVTCGEPGSCDDSIDCASKGGAVSGTCCLKTSSECGICRKSVAYCGLRLCDLCRT